MKGYISKGKKCLFIFGPFGERYSVGVNSGSDPQREENENIVHIEFVSMDQT